MDSYRETLKSRIVILLTGAVILIALMVLTQSGIVSTVKNESFSSFLRGFQAGLLFWIIVIFASLAGRYIWLLRREEKLKAAYCAENDERRKLIMMKIGGTPMYVCIIVMLLGGIAAGYFNETTFYSIAGCAVFLLLVRLFLSIYYHKKY